MSAQKRKRMLTKEDLKKYRELLLQQRREILGDVERMEDEALRSGSDDVSVDHMADHGSDSYEKDQTIGLIERESFKLKAIGSALRKLDEGTYGICEECDGPIKKARLKAIPHARLCLDCKMAEEGS